MRHSNDIRAGSPQRPKTPAERLALGYFLLLITMLGWSGAWITARVAAYDAPPLSVTLGRYLIASLALLPVWWLFERRKAPRLVAGDIVLLIGMSLTGIILYNVLFLVAISMAPASGGAVIVPGLTGVFSLAIASMASRIWPARSSLLGTALSLGGSVLVGWAVLRSAGASSDRVLGMGIFVISAASMAIYTVLGKRLSARVPPITGVFLASLIGAVLLLPIVFWWDGVPDPRAWSRAAMFNVVYLGLGATALALTTYYLAIQLIGIDRAAPALGMVPFFAVLGATQLLGEQLMSLHLIGGLLVILGIVLPALGLSNPPAPKPADE